MRGRILVWVFLACLSNCRTTATNQGRQQQPEAVQPATASINQECTKAGLEYKDALASCECGYGRIWEQAQKACIDHPEKKRCDDRRSLARWGSGRCICSDADENWDGSDCRRGTASSQTEKERCEKVSAARWQTSTSRCVCDDSNLQWDGSRCTSGSLASSADFTRICEAADGTIFTNGGVSVCECGRDRLLVGTRCEDFRPSSLRDACEATIGAAWRGGRCECSRTQEVFSPTRGGCVAKESRLPEPIAQRICVSFKGTWQSNEGRCYCPRDYFWHQELCQEIAEVDDEALCVSDFNQGVWRSGRCRCFDDRDWDGVEKRCSAIPTSAGNAEDSCIRYSGARWDSTRETCICPVGSSWVSIYKECAISSQGSTVDGDQLCRRSGGNPGGRPGQCDCGNKRTGYYKDWQVCIEDSSSNVIDVLETILRIAF